MTAASVVGATGIHSDSIRIRLAFHSPRAGDDRMKLVHWAAAMLLAAAITLGDDTSSATSADAPRRLDVREIVESLYDVGSHVEDKNVPWNYHKSKNYPRKMTDKDTFGETDKVSVVVDTKESTSDHGFDGF